MKLNYYKLEYTFYRSKGELTWWFVQIHDVNMNCFKSMSASEELQC